MATSSMMLNTMMENESKSFTLIFSEIVVLDHDNHDHRKEIGMMKLLARVKASKTMTK